MNRSDADIAASLASEFGVPVSEVSRAVESFFGVILSEARSLPFDTPRKIYSRSKFSEYGSVRCIPYIGRIGPSYTRYLRWRANESKGEEMMRKPRANSKYDPEEVERYAAELLSGKNPESPAKKPLGKVYDRVWLVGTGGKKQARQVIIKKKQ